MSFSSIGLVANGELRLRRPGPLRDADARDDLEHC